MTSFFTPILNNPDFTPGILDDGFKHWCILGVIRLGDMFSDNKLMSFVELTQKYQLFKHDFFRFLQLRHYITNNTTLVRNCEISSIERLLFLSSGKMYLGRFYGAMRSISSADTPRIKTKWEEELATDIDDKTWDDIWSYAKKISVCTHTREIQFKIIHRLHISPNRRHFSNLCVWNVKLK